MHLRDVRLDLAGADEFSVICLSLLRRLRKRLEGSRLQ
jgi:hypothetical protein